MAACLSIWHDNGSKPLHIAENDGTYADDCQHAQAFDQPEHSLMQACELLLSRFRGDVVIHHRQRFRFQTAPYLTMTHETEPRCDNQILPQADGALQ